MSWASTNGCNNFTTEKFCSLIMREPHGHHYVGCNRVITTVCLRHGHSQQLQGISNSNNILKQTIEQWYGSRTKRLECLVFYSSKLYSIIRCRYQLTYWKWQVQITHGKSKACNQLLANFLPMFKLFAEILYDWKKLWLVCWNISCSLIVFRGHIIQLFFST